MAYGGHGDFGASQFAGAGFIQSQANPVESAYGSGGTRKAQSAEQTLRAVTIKQLLRENLNGTSTVDGMEITTVSLLGRITKLDDKNSVQTQLVLDDGTCSVDVILFTDDSSEETPQEGKRHDWHVGSYVRVVGNLRHFQQKTSVQAYSIRPVRDHNEVTYHLLQCIFQHVHLTKGAAPAAGNTAGAYAPKSQAGGGHTSSHSTLPAAAGASSLNDAVLAYYRVPENASRDVCVDEVEAALRTQGFPVTRQAVAIACNALCDDGLLYQSVDEQTFRCT